LRELGDGYLIFPAPLEEESPITDVHPMPDPNDDQYSDGEAADQRRDAMLLRALKTPPQPRPKRDRGEAKPVTASKSKKASRAPDVKDSHERSGG
jgi:hypothetical protein